MIRGTIPGTTRRATARATARATLLVGAALFFGVFAGCNGPKTQRGASQAALVGPPPPPAAQIPAPASRPMRFAIIGDFGDPNPAADRVAAMVRSWHPDLVLSVGDNNYPVGAAATIDANIGKRYGAFIKPYKGHYGQGSPDINRFYSALGNHDWYANNAAAYFDWFQLPGNERYYDVLAGPAHLFFIDSDRHEPDGIDKDSRQAQWLRRGLGGSKAPFRFVLFHHAPFNSGRHTPSIWMRWPFADWGATLTLAGHDHHYERLYARGLYHVVTGHGGRHLYPFAGPVSEASQVRVYGVFGAVRATVSQGYARFESITTDGVVIDSFGLPPSYGPDAAKGKPRVLRALGQSWHMLKPGTTPARDWATAPIEAATTAKPMTTPTPWQTIRAPAGRGLANLATTIPEGPDTTTKTLFFRATVKVASNASGALPRWLRLRLVRDDGARVLINGVEVWRLNLPLGAIGPMTAAGYDVQWGNESDVIETWLPASVLKAGDNIVAVSLHQAAGAAHDARFDLGLDVMD